MLTYLLRTGRKPLPVTLCGVCVLAMVFGNGLVRWHAEGGAFLLGPAVLVLMGLAAMLLAERRSDSSLRKIGDALNRLTLGDTDVQLPCIESSGEIARVSRAVLHLRDAIRLRIQAEEEAYILLVEKNAVLDQAPAAILLERDGVIVACNARLEALFGYLPGELVGLESSALYADERAPGRIAEEMSAAWQRGDSWSSEAEMRRKDGSCFWGSLQACVRAAADAPSSIWVYADISDAKRAEHDLRQRLLRLERLVSARTHQLEEARRVTARVDTADGLAELPDLVVEPFLDGIPFDPAGVVEGVIVLMAPRTEEKNLELLLQIDPEVPPLLLGAPLRIAQVLTNLLNIVIGAAKKGDIAVVVREVGRDRRKVRLQFNVYGPGPEKEVDQAKGMQNACTDELGLVLSKRLVESMGGLLEMENKSGTGVSFHFTAAFRLTGEAAEKAKRYGDQLQTVRGRRVMVVDDNRSARQVIGALLSRLGLVPMLFESGWAALASLVATNAPNYLVICVDLRMPEIDGLDVAYRLHAHYGTACPPIFLLAAPGHNLALPGLPPGVAGVISKPITFDRLFWHLAATFRTSTHDPGGKAVACLKGKRVLFVSANGLQRETTADFLHGVGGTVRVAANGIEAMQAVREEAMDCIMLDCGTLLSDACETAGSLRAHGYADLPIIGLSADISGADRASCLAAGMNQLVDNVAGLPAVLAKWTNPSASSCTQGGILPPLPPELDIKSGLQRLRGKTGLFLKALRMFRDSCGRQFQLEFRSAVSAGDWRTSELLARSLKGSAATIGATQVSDAAARLEAAIQSSNYAEAKFLLAEVTEKLRVLVDQLSLIG